jgi:hypothetical protein
MHLNIFRNSLRCSDISPRCRCSSRMASNSIPYRKFYRQSVVLPVNLGARCQLRMLKTPSLWPRRNWRRFCVEREHLPIQRHLTSNARCVPVGVFSIHADLFSCQECGQGLKGEKGARAHAEQTGHVRFGEY